VARNPNNLQDCIAAFTAADAAAHNISMTNEGALIQATLAQAWATIILAQQVTTLREALVMGDDLALIAKELATIAEGRKA